MGHGASKQHAAAAFRLRGRPSMTHLRGRKKTSEAEKVGMQFDATFDAMLA
jgi:hypothetical protein